jgi:peptidoglycan/xylan/chitin deacetylase (PgdA/CDA1 family)
MRGTKDAVKAVGTVADRLVPPPAGITVLAYHRVGGGSTSDVDLEVAAFERQVAHLAEHHDVISLDDAVPRLCAPENVAPAVVVTVDDGTADLTEHLLPVLCRYGVPATVFLATRFVDEGAPFPDGTPPTSWSALRDAAGPLVTYGSHTHDHVLLDRTDGPGSATELDRSIGLIEDQLGHHPRHFAYPKAMLGCPAAEIEVRRRFSSAAIAGNRVNVPGRTDLHRLARTPVQRSDGFDHFTRKAAGGHRLEGELRELTARVRYRATTR